MAEKTKTSSAGTRGSALDLPMAALAAGSLGFFAYAMPSALFERLIGATGLPGFVPAAQPPLGDTARLGFVTIAALAAFALVWLLLRKLNRAPTAAPAWQKTAEVPVDPPRLRRADMHPDAPSRRPVRAGSDFGIPLDSVPIDERGEPVDVSVVENVDFDAEWERPAPSFLQSPADQARAEEEQDEPVESQTEEEETPTFETYEAPAAETYEAPAADTYEAESEADAAPADVPFWLPEGAQETGEDEAGAELELSEQAPLPATDAILPFWAQQAQADTGENAAHDPEPSLDQLSTRLEGGLIRRKRDGRSTRPRGSRGADDRLRTALDDLTRMSKRS